MGGPTAFIRCEEWTASVAKDCIQGRLGEARAVPAPPLWGRPGAPDRT